MTDTTTESGCTWCRRPGATHTADQHPLPAGHPDYEAFYDATDSQLAAMASAAFETGRRYAVPDPTDVDPGRLMVALAAAGLAPPTDQPGTLGTNPTTNGAL